MEPSSDHEEQALLGHARNGSWSSEESHMSAADVEMDDLGAASLRVCRQPSQPRWLRRSRTDSIAAKTSTTQIEFVRARRKRSRYHRLWRLALILPYILVALLVVTAVFFPSYTTPPQRYSDLRQRVLTATRDGAANPHNEKVFIAASLYDGDGSLLQGHWAQSVLHLVDMLGHNNVFVSVYENDPSDAATQALSNFRQRLPCSSSVVKEKLDTSTMDHVMTDDGEQRLKRMSFLAEVRNKALQPLADDKSEAYNVTWDKLLYMNDIAFDPIDAANLLLSTNVNERTGRTHYRAACSIDFIHPFKYYDTFATRDLEGYELGVPIYPWFANAGAGESRADVLSQTDAVRVKSCWGGMVAFEAKWFQQRKQGDDDANGPTRSNDRSPSTTVAAATIDTPTATSPMRAPDAQLTKSNHINLTRSQATPNTALHFRSSPKTFWDASECCLIHADLAHLTTTTVTNPSSSPTSLDGNTGIYVNPYIRVSYTPSTLRWLGFLRRFERLFTPLHTIINLIAGRPGVNERRLEKVGEEVERWVWRWDDNDVGAGNGTKPLTGRYVSETVVAEPGGFCGERRLLYINEGREDQGERGEGKHWAAVKAPEGPWEWE